MFALSDDEKAKLAKQPNWVREAFARLQLSIEPMIAECAKARRERDALADLAKQISASNEALLEILRFAGRGGSDWAATVVKTLEGYEIFREGHSDVVQE